jgi:putative transport protein
VLFLAVVGLKSGGDFVDTLVKGEGMSWVGYGIFIRDPAADGGHSGADVRQNELSDALRYAGGLHDRPPRSPLPITCTPPAVRRRSLRHGLSAGDVPAHHHPQLLAVLFWGMS